jgi:tetratricopeptide (TPR) repeat protein
MNTMKTFLLAMCITLGCLTTTLPLHAQGLSDTDQVEFLLFESTLHLEQGEILKAVASLSQVVALDPGRMDGHLLYAQALTRGLLDGLFENPRQAAETARAHYAIVLELAPDSREAKAGIGLLEDTFLAEAPSPMKTDEGTEAWVRGQQATRERDYQGAISAFQEATNLEPDSPAAHGALGEALRREDHLDRAVRAFRRALKLDPTYVPALVGMGQTQESLHKESSAIDYYRQALDANPDSRKAASGVVRILEAARQQQSIKTEERSLLGRSYLVLERYDLAVEMLEEALSSNPDFATRKALGIAEFFRENDVRALSMLDKALDENPQDLEVLYYMGASSLRVGDMQAGRAFLKRLLEADPGNPNAHRLIGLSLVDEPGQAENAVRHLLAAHTGGARIKSLSCILGTLYMRLRRGYDATAAFEDCLTEDPEFSGAYLGLGILADDLGQTRDAIRYLDQYLDMETDPDRAAIFRLGVAYLRSGQDEVGFTTLRRVVSANRVTAEGDTVDLTDTELLEATSFFLASVRRFNDAIFIGETLLTQDPENSIYNNNLAMSYADAGLKIGRAHALALRANRIAPDNPGHMDTLAWVLIRMNKYTEAEEMLLDTVRLAGEQDPEQNLSEIYYHLGYLYLQTQEHDKARDYLEKASQDPPTIFLKSEINRLIEQANTEAENH